MPRASYFSADAVRALPEDGNRYETVHGELLVSPAPVPLHQRVIRRLAWQLDNYLLPHGIEQVMPLAADISWSDDTLVQPDLFVGELAEAMKSGKWSDVQTLHLVIEVLSPSSIRADRFTKRRLYQEQRIPVYWIVDLEHAQVEIWTPDVLFPVVEQERVTWRHPALDTDCTITLGQLFGT